MQLNRQASNFILRKRFVQQIKHKPHVKWIAVPVEVISFYSPDVANYPSLFRDPILKLIQTQVSSITELSRLIGLSKDLVLYILGKELSEEVQTRGDYVEMKNESAHPLPSLSVRELSEYYIFRLPVTGALLPRPVSSKEPLWSTSDLFTSQGFPLFEFGSKGRPFRIGPFLLPAVSGKDGRSLDEQAVRDAIDQYTNDYAAALDFFGEEKIREDATKKVSRIRTIEKISVMYEAHLITVVISDDSEEDFWSCADPFGVFQNRGVSELKAEVEAICTQSEQSKKVLNDMRAQLAGITVNTSAYQHAASEVDSRFPVLPSALLRRALITLAARYSDLDAANEREREVYEDTWSNFQKTLETLFKHYWKDGLQQKTELFTGKTAPSWERRQYLELVLPLLGSQGDVALIQKLSGLSMWKYAHEANATLKSLLLGAILLAEEDKDHVLRVALRLDKNIIGTIVDIADFRNKKGAHATGKSGTLSSNEKEELDVYIEKTYRIVEAFIGKKEEQENVEKK